MAAPLTNATFYDHVRSGRDARASRLSAVDLLGRYTGTRVPAGALHPKPVAQLAAALDQHYRQPGGADLPADVVSCDGTAVAWLTCRGHVVAPAADLTPFQERHREQALRALEGVTDHVLVRLAEYRDTREQRTVTQPPTEPGSGGWVRVAAAGEPTLTWWTRVPGDYDAAYAHVAAVVGSPDIRVLRSGGYGVGPRVLRHPRLMWVCAIQATAETCDVPPAVVGEWAISAGCHDPDAARRRFPAVYAGRFANQEEFTDHTMRELGWTRALTAVGMPLAYVDRRRLTYDLFRDEYTAVTIPGGGIAVIAR